MEDSADKIKRLEKERYQRNRDTRIAYAKAWNKAHPEKCREYYKKAYAKRRNGGNQTKPELNRSANILLGPPVFIFHGKGEKVSFN